VPRVAFHDASEREEAVARSGFAHLLSLPTPRSARALSLMRREKGGNTTKFGWEGSVLSLGRTVQFGKAVWGFGCSGFAVRVQVAVTQRRSRLEPAGGLVGVIAVLPVRCLVCIRVKREARPLPWETLGER